MSSKINPLKPNGYLLPTSEEVVLTSKEVSMIPLMCPHKEKEVKAVQREHQSFKDQGYTPTHGYNYTIYRKPYKKDLVFGC